MEEPAKAKIRAIARSADAGNCVFFMGAGVARDGAGAPTFDDMAASLIDRPEIPEHLKVLKISDGRLAEGVSPSQVVEYFCDHQASSTTLYEFLEEKLGALQPTGQAYKMIAQLANKDVFDHIYTTNVEGLLKDCLGDRAELIVLPEQQDALFRNRGKVKIVCLHGNYKAHNARLTETQILTAFVDLPKTWSSLQEDMWRKTMVFVGYSFRDDSIRFLLGYLLGLNKGKAPEPWYVVFPKHSLVREGEADALALARWELLESVWRGRDVRLIDRTAEAFFTELHAQISYDRVGPVVERVADHLGVSVEKATTMLNALANDWEFSKTDTLGIVARLLGLQEE
jgi:hypothetical protein